MAAAVGSLVVLLLPVRPPLGLWVVNGVLVVAAVADWWLAVRPAEVEVERELPGIVPLGTEARVVWRISRRAGPARVGRAGAGRDRGVRVRVADELAPSLGAVTRRVRVVVPARGRVTAATVIRPARRGRFVLGEVVVRVEGPLGLVGEAGAAEAARGAAGVPAVRLAGRGRAAGQQGQDPGGRAAVGPGARWRDRVRLPARVRGRRRVPADRLGGHRQVGQADRAHLPRRAEPDGAAAPGQRADHGRAGRRRAPAGPCDGCRR